MLDVAGAGILSILSQFKESENPPVLGAGSDWVSDSPFINIQPC